MKIIRKDVIVKRGYEHTHHINQNLMLHIFES